MMRYLWLWLLAGGILFAAEEREVAGNGRVNIRQAPSTKAKTVGTLNPGDNVKIKGIKGDWAELADRPGFVAARLLRTKPLPPPGKPGAPEKPLPPPGKPGAPEKPLPPPGKPGPEQADAVRMEGKKSDNPFADLPVIPKSGKDVTLKGMLYPMKGKGSTAYVLLKAVDGKYQVLCYVYVYKKDAAKFAPLANKDVQLVGTWYKVKDWKKPVLQVRSIREL